MENLLDLNFEEPKMTEESNFLEIEEVSTKDIAIIGVSAQMPMADQMDEFWNLLINKIDCIREIPAGRKQDAEAFLRFKKHYREGMKFQESAYLEEVDRFDYKFFGISPKEASLMDPNQRIFLQTAWNVLEDAGYGGDLLKGSRTGVYLGYSGDAGNEYRKLISEVEPESLDMSTAGNVSSIIASRISYLMDFRGPSMAIDTACSSALVALHSAVRGIRNGDCDLAIVGGIKIRLMPLEMEAKLGIESSDGRAKTFDDRSDGTGGGEGVITLLLKPLDKAIRDKDLIHAVVKGSAINQDGASIGITAPNAVAQEDVITRAWSDANVDPQTVTLLEAHGTGTKLGDPIEIEGIERAFRRYTDRNQFCAIGSVKTNVGHLDTAAGLAGVLKMILALKAKKIPPMLHFQRPNRKIDFVQSPVYIADQLLDWEVDGVRRCGISSFGLSGTNCHVVLEEAPEREQELCSDQEWQIFKLSAKSETALTRLVDRYHHHLKKHQLSLQDLCYTANTGRGSYTYRLAIIASTLDQFMQKIAQLQQGLATDETSQIYYGVHRVLNNNQQPTQVGDLTLEGKQAINQEIQQVMENLRVATQDRSQELAKLAKLYVQGADLNWLELYPAKGQKVSLPVYPFDQHRCWLEIPDVPYMENVLEEAGLYYQTEWRPKELMSGKLRANSGATLIFLDEKGLGQQLVTHFKEQDQRVITVELGAQFVEQAANQFTIRPEYGDYLRLIGELKARNLTQILHLASIRNDQSIDQVLDLEAAQNRGSYSLLLLTKALLEDQVDTQLDLVLVAEDVHSVTGQEQVIRPEQKPMLALGRVVWMENLNLKSRAIDIDETMDVQQLFTEITTQSNDDLVAYRQGKRYVEALTTANIDQITDEPVELHPQGVYVITGGTGTIGLELGKYLASQAQVKLALVNRSSMPDRKDWAAILAAGQEPNLIRKIEGVQLIEELGAEVACYRADISNPTDLQNLLSQLRQEYGKINGIFHGAGIGVGREAIYLKDAQLDQFREVLSPKVHGTWLLDQETREDQLDFMVLFSSAITYVGGIGGGDYTAANAYLDTYTEYRNRCGHKTLTINWPSWKESFAEHVNEDKQLFKMIQATQATPALEKVLNKKISRITIGELNLESKLFKLGEQLPFILSDEVKKQIHGKMGSIDDTGSQSQLPTDVKLTGKEAGDYTDVEELLGQIWGKVLGVKEINIHDSFFDLGGDSISILKVANFINERFETEFSVGEMFVNPTIAGLAENIHTEDMLSKLECIVKLNNSSSDKNLFILHGRDGTVYYYKELAKLLEKDFNVYGVQAKGLVRETVLPKNAKEMLQNYIREIKMVQPEGPYYIGGYCMGSILSYELVRIMEDLGDQIEKCLILDEHAFIPDPYIKLLRMREGIGNVFKPLNFMGSGHDELDQSMSEMAASDEEKEFEVTDYESYRQSIIDNINFIVNTNYRPKRLIKTPTLVIKAEENLEPRLNQEDWSKMVNAPVDLFEISGDHDSIFEIPNVNKLAEILQKELI